MEQRRWANYFEVGYNAYEVVLRFGQFYAQNGEVQWHTRIVTHPAYARELLRTLKDSIDEHERSFPAGKGGQMPNEVKYNVKLEVKDGPKLELSETLTVHAYDKVEFELRSQQYQEVDLQPTGDSTQLHFLLIQAKPDPKSDPTDRASVWYSVDGGDYVQLASNHALLGKGVIQLLAKPPRVIKFHNRRSTPVTLTCLVGRDNKADKKDTGTGGTSTEYPGDTGGGGTQTPPGGGGGTPTYPGGGGGTTPTYPGGGGGGTTPTYPGGGGGTPTYPGGGGGGTPTYPGGGGGTPPTYPGGGGGGSTPPPGYPGGGGTPPADYPGGGGGGTPPEYPGGGTPPEYPGGGGGGGTPGYPGRGGESTTPPPGPGRTRR
jgi:hypothetical protein